MEKTFSIIKPNAVNKNAVGAILHRFESEGLRVAAMRKVQLARPVVEGFYAEHKHRSFFGELVDFMCSGPVVILVLEGEGAVLRNREIMGATDPAKAADGTLRKLYGDSMGENAVHGSDSPASAAREIAWFFAGSDVY